MATSRCRRIVRCTVMAVAAVALLVGMHIGGFVVFAYASGAGKIPTQLKSVVGPTYLPIDLYMESGLPGSTTLIEARRWAVESGIESATK